MQWGRLCSCFSIDHFRLQPRLTNANIIFDIQNSFNTTHYIYSSKKYPQHKHKRITHHTNTTQTHHTTWLHLKAVLRALRSRPRIHSLNPLIRRISLPVLRQVLLIPQQRNHVLHLLPKLIREQLQLRRKM